MKVSRKCKQPRHLFLVNIIWFHIFDSCLVMRTFQLLILHKETRGFLQDVVLCVFMFYMCYCFAGLLSAQNKPVGTESER